MPGARRQGREAALQVLYLNDISRNTLREVPEPVWSAEPLTPKTREFAARLAEGVSAHRVTPPSRIIMRAADAARRKTSNRLSGWIV